jgi:hypothetical protein
MIMRGMSGSLAQQHLRLRNQFLRVGLGPAGRRTARDSGVSNCAGDSSTWLYGKLESCFLVSRQRQRLVFAMSSI